MKTRQMIVLATILLLPGAANAAWSVDGAHTEVNFSVKHFFTPVTGSFSDFEIDLAYDPENLEASSVEARISIALAVGQPGDRVAESLPASRIDRPRRPRFARYQGS